jgi:SAM-dependent methyltransferase
LYLSLLYFRMIEHMTGEDISRRGTATTSDQAFTLSAPFYDAEQSSNLVARWSRARSIKVLDMVFAPGDFVLELGCGTGEEALHLARRGVHVVATDAAAGMLEVLEVKLSRENAAVRERVTLIAMPARDTDKLIARFGPGSFDGAYSSFGPLNCEPDLSRVVDALAALVKPGGSVILSLINRYCPWETAWYLAAGRPRKAFRRSPGRALATVRSSWRTTRIPVYYWSLGQVERWFCPHFQLTRRMALPWLLPPQYLDGLLRGRPRLFRLLAKIDRMLAGAWPFNALGDHTLFELRRSKPE